MAAGVVENFTEATPAGGVAVLRKSTREPGSKSATVALAGARVASRVAGYAPTVNVVFSSTLAATVTTTSVYPSSRTPWVIVSSPALFWRTSTTDDAGGDAACRFGRKLGSRMPRLPRRLTNKNDDFSMSGLKGYPVGGGGLGLPFWSEGPGLSADDGQGWNQGIFWRAAQAIG